MKVRLSKLLGISIYFILVLILTLYTPYSNSINNFIGGVVLILSCVYVYKCKDNFLLLCMSLFIAYCNYSIVVGVYFYPELRPIMYAQIADIKVYGILITLVLLYMLALVFFQNKNIVQNNISMAETFVRRDNYNNILFIIAVMAFLLIWIVGYERNDGGRGSLSPIYEYDSIFLLIMYYYSGKKKHLNYVCYGCVALYTYTSLSNGTRIEAIICIFILLFCSIRKKVPIKHVLLVGVIGIVLMNVVGVFRGNYTSLSQGIETVLKNTVEEKLVFDTPVHAYFPAVCMVEKTMNYSINDSFYYLYRFILTIFAGNGRIVDGNLISVMKRYYYHNSGGLTIGFFYVWFSFLGPMIFAKIISLFSNVVRKYGENKADVINCMAIYFTANVPRWYLYGPIVMFRGVLICGIVFSVFIFTRKWVIRR